MYHATGGAGADGAPTAELAIKVYKTAILVFRDRDRWVRRVPWGLPCGCSGTATGAPQGVLAGGAAGRPVGAGPRDPSGPGPRPAGALGPLLMWAEAPA